MKKVFMIFYGNRQKGGIITWNDVQKAIQWCIDNKMDIINFSYTNVNSEITKNLLQKCYDNNINALQAWNQPCCIRLCKSTTFRLIIR